MIKLYLALFYILPLSLLVACNNAPLAQPNPNPNPITSTSTSTTVVEPTPFPLPETSATQPLTNGVTVEGYTFSYPQEVPDGLGPVRIIGWLPDSPDEIVVIEGRRLVAINIYSGQVRPFSQTFEDGIPPRWVHLLKNDQIIFLSYDDQLEMNRNIWLSGADDKQAQTPIARDTQLFPIALPNQTEVILYKADTQQMQRLNQMGEKVAAPATQSTLLAPLTIPEMYLEYPYLWLQSAVSPHSPWTAVYNQEHFSLIDFRTGETKTIELKYEVDKGVWSPDGQKLALLVTEGPRPIPFMKLFVLDIQTEKLQEIETGFEYVQDVTWAPDSENLLIAAITGEGTNDTYVYDISALFLVNIFSSEVNHLDILPDKSVLGFKWGLAWALDGKKVAITTVYPPFGNPQLYQIDVSLVIP